MIKAILLDLDDTLFLTQKQSFRIMNEVMKKMGREPVDLDVHIKTWGMIMTESMPLRSPGINYEEFKVIFDKTRQKHMLNNDIDIIPTENLEILEILLKQGKHISIVTSRTEPEVRHLLEDSHPLSKSIKDIYHKDNTKYHKPDPKVFDEFFKKEGFGPEECVYVGDSVGDAEASTKAGMKFIASLESGLRDKSYFNGQKVNYFIDKFTDLPKAIKHLEEAHV